MKYTINTNPSFQSIEITNDYQEIIFYFSTYGKTMVASEGMTHVLYSLIPESAILGEFFYLDNQGFGIRKMQPIHEKFMVHSLESVLKQAKNQNLMDEALHQKIKMELRQYLVNTFQNNNSSVEDEIKIAENSILTQFNDKKITEDTCLKASKEHSAHKKSKKTECTIF